MTSDERTARLRRIAVAYPAAVAEALSTGASERRIVGLILAWATDRDVADGLRGYLLRLSRGAFAAGF